MKNHLRVIMNVMLALVLTFACTSVVYADDFTTVNHTVTIDVPEVLSLSADAGNFTLTFPDFVTTGSETDTKTVVYTVKSNNMGQADDSAAMNANLDFLYDRVDLKAQVGSYTKVSGNTELAAASAGFVTIDADVPGVALANKANSTDDGRVLNGSIPVTYKGVATADVPSGPQTHILYVTLTTI